jgi:hypothetical protein
MAGILFSVSNLKVPPVDKISTPCALSAWANSTIPVLSETLINARFTATRSVALLRWESPE